MDVNNLSVFPQGVAVSDIRRELLFWKKIKIPILWVLENSGVCLSSLKCKSHSPKQILFGGNTQGGGGIPIHGIYIIIYVVGKGMVLRKDISFPLLTLHIIDLFSLGGLFSQCRPRDDTLENSCSVARIWLNNFKMDKREILQRISHDLQWENKPSKLKRSIVFMVWSFDRVPA